MKILYVQRSDKERRRKGGFATEVKHAVREAGLQVKRHFFFSPIDGYFESALCNCGDVTRVSNANFSRVNQKNYDVLAVNFRCVGGKLRGDNRRLIELASSFQGLKLLFIDADEARFMLEDAVLDFYNIIYKREPFIDLDRYSISNANRSKVRPTMLSCPYYVHSPYKFLESEKHKALLDVLEKEKASDVFFIGKASKERIEAWQEIKKMPKLKAAGGLLPRKGKLKLDPALETMPVSEEKFISSLMGARVNLAIDGHGEFTFRHLEIWRAGGFLLSHANLRDIWLPISMREHEHFECYGSVSELLEKVDYFIANPEEADRIGLNGRKTFLSEYSIERHGQSIFNELSALM